MPNVLSAMLCNNICHILYLDSKTLCNINTISCYICAVSTFSADKRNTKGQIQSHGSYILWNTSYRIIVRERERDMYARTRGSTHTCTLLTGQYEGLAKSNLSDVN